MIFSSGIAPLFLAAKTGQMELVRALVKSGSHVNAPGGGQGITALHWAAFKEMEALVIFLIENGANVEAVDKNGRTPLAMVSEKLQLKMKGKGTHEGKVCYALFLRSLSNSEFSNT